MARAATTIVLAILLAGCSSKGDRYEVVDTCSCGKADGGTAYFVFQLKSLCSGEEGPVCPVQDASVCGSTLAAAGCATPVRLDCRADDTNDFCP